MKTSELAAHLRMSTQEENCARLLELGWTKIGTKPPYGPSFERGNVMVDVHDDGTDDAVFVYTRGGRPLGSANDVDTALEKGREFCTQNIKAYTKALEDLK